jgi:hypothetical protein
MKGGIEMKTTRKQLENLLQIVCDKIGIRHGHYEKIGDKWQPIANGLALGHNSHYGGYEVQQIDGNGGTGVTVVSGDRKSAYEMRCWLKGILDVDCIRR